MSWQNSLAFLGFPGITLCPALVIFSLLPPQHLAQSYPETKISLTFPQTQKRGAPPRTAGGGTRGPSCTQGDGTPLTALMPSNNVGTTVTANPTFFWYVPKTTVKVAKFVVLDDTEKVVYQTTLAISGTPGIVRLSLPPTTSLKVGKTYHWNFALICNPQDPTGLVEGWLERTAMSPALEAELLKAPPLEQAKLYAKAGIWQETLTILARLRCSRPAEWEELIESVGLDAAIAQAPFVECLKPKSNLGATIPFRY